MSCLCCCRLLPHIHMAQLGSHARWMRSGAQQRSCSTGSYAQGWSQPRTTTAASSTLARSAPSLPLAPCSSLPSLAGLPSLSSLLSQHPAALAAPSRDRLHRFAVNRAGQLSKVMSLFVELQSRGLQPDKRSFRNAIIACTSENQVWGRVRSPLPTVGFLSSALRVRS